MSAIAWLRMIAIVELLCALLWPGVYLMSYDVLFGSGTSSLFARTVAVGGLAFLIAPVASVWGSFRNRKWAIYPLLLFPVLAFIYGISVVPYLSRIAPVGAWRTVALVVINGSVVWGILKARRAYVAAVA